MSVQLEITGSATSSSAVAALAKEGDAGRGVWDVMETSPLTVYLRDAQDIEF